METTIPPREEISHYECMHASYTKSLDNKHDMVVVKELIHCHDKRIIPNLRLITDYQRDFYTTLDNNRTHKDKKTFESIKKLRKHSCRQIDLQNSVARALGKPGSTFGLRQLARTPYLYGTDIDTPVLIKRGYKDRFPKTATPARVAVYDLEHNMAEDAEQEVILGSMTMKDKCFTAVLDSWVKHDPDFEAKLRKRAEELIGDTLKERNITLEIMVVDSPGKIIVECFKRAHAWQPDYVSIFNMDYDIPKSLAMLASEGIDPRTVFCDPRIPWDFRTFRYVKGKTSKKNKQGVEKKINFEDQWHYCENTASFIICDSMTLYKRIRIASPNEPSYSLDAILQRNGLDGKLKFEEADGLVKGEWHTFVQEKFPVEYAVYNIIDCIRVEQLDEKNKDIAMSLGALLKSSQYKNFDSQPKMIADDFYFFGLKHNLIIASTSDQMLTEIDDFSPRLKNWIITLPAYMVQDAEDLLIKDLPGNHALIFTNVSDIDVVSTYPTLQQKLNVDRATTVMELSSVEGMEEEEWRHVGIDMTAARTNSVMICNKMFGLPSMDDMLGSMMEHMAKEEAANDAIIEEVKEAA